MHSMEDAFASLKVRILPSIVIDDFAHMLQRCRKERNSVFAARLHVHMTENGLDTCLSLGNDLLSLLVDVGYVNSARNVFEKLSRPHQSSWNSLLVGYIKHGDVAQAFLLYEKMRLDSTLRLNGPATVALLRSCGNHKDLERGKQVHLDIADKDLFKKDLYVGSALVDMYSKCGSLFEAHQLLDVLPVRDTVSWTALISGYVEQGFNIDALNCFEQMQCEGVLPDAVTYACSLKACTSMMDIERGESIHVEISRNGLEKNYLVGNTLVCMYSKFGFLVKAQEVFDNITSRTAVSWTALISAYADHGYGKEALICIRKMQEDGICPDIITYVCGLKACGIKGASIEGQEIHTEIVKRGLENVLISTTLVDMYAKNGFLEEARDHLMHLAVRDVVLWTALIDGYVENGFSEAALECFEQMQEEGISPDSVTFACSLKACGCVGAAHKGREIHEEINARDLAKDYFIGNCLIDMYCKCGLLLKAREAFQEILSKDVVSWTALMNGFVEHGSFQEALDLFEEMCNEGISSDAVSFVCSLKACGGMKDICKGEEIYTELLLKGLERDLSVGSSLVDMYSKCGLLVEAQEIFNKLADQNIVAWNALIGGYVEHGFSEVALECFHALLCEKIPLHAVTFLCALKACGNSGTLEAGQDVHSKIVEHGLESDSVVGNSLADLYVKCGLVIEAQMVFATLPVQDEVSWNTLISGYSQLGDSQAVFSLCDKMVESDTKPNLITFLSVLNVCSNAGLLEEACAYFQSMKNMFGINPSPEHHNCIVDLLGRSGLVEIAVALIGNLPFHPGLVLWHSILGACRKSGDVDLGKEAFESAMHLDENDVSSYIALSNIYVDVD
ncbi:hypothetical protein KP509_28G015300 [Ceratopteris richardii]|nr:hypothetical protein KP509_28G015300 [Ceratopteris richardii]